MGPDQADEGFGAPILKLLLDLLDGVGDVDLHPDRFPLSPYSGRVEDEEQIGK